MDGNLTVAGVSLASGEVRINASGLQASGTAQLGGAQVHMSGQFGEHHASLTGSFGVGFDLRAPATIPVLTTCDNYYHHNGEKCGWTPRTCHERVCTIFGCTDVPYPCGADANSCWRTEPCWRDQYIGDHYFGRFEGNVSATLGTQGLGGSVAGQFCDAAGACQSMGASVSFSGTRPRVCVHTPIPELGTPCFDI